MKLFESVKRMFKHEFTYSTFHGVCQGLVVGGVFTHNVLNITNSSDCISKLCPDVDKNHITLGLYACTFSKTLVYGYMGPVALAFFASHPDARDMAFSPGSALISWKTYEKKQQKQTSY